MQAAHLNSATDTHQQLVQLRERLSVYQTMSCRLMHEQVQSLNEETITPDADAEKLRVTRKGFCDSALRRKMLGCAHTKANDTFARLADEVYRTGILETTAPPSIAIRDLIVKIYLMDHEKGLMEKQAALAQHLQHSTEAIAFQQGLNELTSRHQSVVKQLEQLRADLMRRIDTAIENYSAAN